MALTPDTDPAFIRDLPMSISGGREGGKIGACFELQETGGDQMPALAPHKLSACLVVVVVLTVFAAHYKPAAPPLDGAPTNCQQPQPMRPVS